jgi:hypothetical protein
LSGEPPVRVQEGPKIRAETGGSRSADAAVTTDTEDREQLGAMDETIALMEGVSVYQPTDKGLALQATLQNTKYWTNDKLD